MNYHNIFQLYDRVLSFTEIKMFPGETVNNYYLRFLEEQHTVEIHLMINITEKFLFNEFLKFFHEKLGQIFYQGLCVEIRNSLTLTITDLKYLIDRATAIENVINIQKQNNILTQPHHLSKLLLQKFINENENKRPEAVIPEHEPNPPKAMDIVVKSPKLIHNKINNAKPNNKTKSLWRTNPKISLKTQNELPWPNFKQFYTNSFKFLIERSVVMIIVYSLLYKLFRAQQKGASCDLRIAIIIKHTTF